MLSILIASWAISTSNATPINELPMFGNQEKTAAQKAADTELIRGIEKLGYSREAAADKAVRQAWLYWRKGDLASAMKRFNQAWLLDPENGNLYHGFAIITFQKNGPVPEVEQYFRLAVSKTKVSARAHVDYGRFLWTQDRFEESISRLEKALEISATIPGARPNMAFVYYRKGDFKAACHWAKAANDNKETLEAGFLDEMCQRAAAAD